MTSYNTRARQLLEMDCEILEVKKDDTTTGKYRLLLRLIPSFFETCEQPFEFLLDEGLVTMTDAPEGENLKPEDLYVSIPILLDWIAHRWFHKNVSCDDFYKGRTLVCRVSLPSFFQIMDDRSPPVFLKNVHARIYQWKPATFSVEQIDWFNRVWAKLRRLRLELVRFDWFDNSINSAITLRDMEEYFARRESTFIVNGFYSELLLETVYLEVRNSFAVLNKDATFNSLLACM